jgi:pyrimidine operon attenuation protein/uracil phosphoribosyltransferase
MKTILDSKQIEVAISDISDQIARDIEASEIVVIGLRSRGVVFARRISAKLSDKFSADIPCGEVDITLYRDDLNNPQTSAQPTVGKTEIPCDIEDKIVLLVDDVLNTGRSVRAAIGALLDFGRPKAIRLAVLVDRGGREFPIQADYRGCTIGAEDNEKVVVSCVETDEIDGVIVE